MNENNDVFDKNELDQSERKKSLWHSTTISENKYSDGNLVSVRQIVETVQKVML